MRRHRDAGGTDTALFAHGVASGDPGPDGVLLWTRVTTGSVRPVRVRWRVSPTPDLAQTIAEGRAEATLEHDFTVKIDVRGFRAATTYHYGFDVGGVASPVGRTRTAPRGATTSLRLGLVSCACWTHGFFNAYGHLADRDVAAVVHLGDYIYEAAGSWPEAGRIHQPGRRLRTLADYRERHAQYKTDPDLQRLHHQHPIVAVWDDHDVARRRLARRGRPPRPGRGRLVARAPCGRRAGVPRVAAGALAGPFPAGPDLPQRHLRRPSLAWSCSIPAWRDGTGRPPMANGPWARWGCVTAPCSAPTSASGLARSCGRRVAGACWGTR